MRSCGLIWSFINYIFRKKHCKYHNKDKRETENDARLCNLNAIGQFDRKRRSLWAQDISLVAGLRLTNSTDIHRVKPSGEDQLTERLSSSMGPLSV